MLSEQGNVRRGPLLGGLLLLGLRVSSPPLLRGLDRLRDFRGNHEHRRRRRSRAAASDDRPARFFAVLVRRARASPRRLSRVRVPRAAPRRRIRGAPRGAQLGRSSPRPRRSAARAPPGSCRSGTAVCSPSAPSAAVTALCTPRIVASAPRATSPRRRAAGSRRRPPLRHLVRVDRGCRRQTKQEDAPDRRPRSYPPYRARSFARAVAPLGLSLPMAPPERRPDRSRAAERRRGARDGREETRRRAPRGPTDERPTPRPPA